MAATAVSIAALASEPAFCAETWNDSSNVPAMAITHVFFIILDQDFRFENGAIVHPVARSRRHFGPKLSASLSTRLIGQRKLNRYSILRAHNFRNVTFARRVFHKIDVPWPHGYLFAARNFALSMAAQ